MWKMNVAARNRNSFSPLRKICLLLRLFTRNSQSIETFCGLSLTYRNFTKSDEKCKKYVQNVNLRPLRKVRFPHYRFTLRIRITQRFNITNTTHISLKELGNMDWNSAIPLTFGRKGFASFYMLDRNGKAGGQKPHRVHRVANFTTSVKTRNFLFSLMFFFISFPFVSYLDLPLSFLLVSGLMRQM
jgi:hypothetical protein